MRRIRHPSTRTKLMLAALSVLVFALGPLANAAGHDRYVKIKSATEVGGTVVEPGSYLVRKVDAGDGMTIEFVREFRGPTIFDEAYRPGPDSPLMIDEFWPDRVVAQVKACKQSLSARASHTRLELAPDTSRAVGLKIRGDNSAYLFASPHPSAMAAPVEAACAP